MKKKTSLLARLARRLTIATLTGVTAIGVAAVGVAFIATPAAAQNATATIPAAEQADLQRVEAYLNSMPSLRSKFLQVDPDGKQSEGEAWLSRPGRMRFQYDAPSKLLLVASNGKAVFHDGELDQTSSIPLTSTPLGLLLADHVLLSGDVTVVSYDHPPGRILLTLTRTASPQDGSLSLYFTDNPLTLRSWTVTDAQSRETKVSLFKIIPGGQFDQALFTYKDPDSDDAR